MAGDLDDVYVDASGDIVRTVSIVDGASLRVDLSNFGDAGTVTLPPQQSNRILTTPPSPPSTAPAQQIDRRNSGRRGRDYDDEVIGQSAHD